MKSILLVLLLAVSGCEMTNRPFDATLDDAATEAATDSGSDSQNSMDASTRE